MFHKVLLPLDLQETELTDRAVALTKDIAARYQSEITVLTVIPDFGMAMVASYFPEDAFKKAHDDVCAELKRIIESRFDDPKSIKCEVLQGKPHKEIVRYAKEHGSDLIIMPARANDVGKLLLGSSTEHVVGRAPCSVLVIRT